MLQGMKYNIKKERVNLLSAQSSVGSRFVLFRSSAMRSSGLTRVPSTRPDVGTVSCSNEIAVTFFRRSIAAFARSKEPVSDKTKLLELGFLQN